MKKNWKHVKLITLGLLVFAIAASCRNKNTGHEGHIPDTNSQNDSQHEEEKNVYTCPMHPEIIRDAPGNCPVCKMDLVKKESDHNANATWPDSSDILLKPSNAYVLSNTTTIRPEKKSSTINIEAPGYLSYDARKLKTVSVRYGGRIERLYVRYPLQTVVKGQRLLDIYSPEMVTAQQEFIFIKEHDSTHATLLDKARQRLSLLGMTGMQIHALESSRKPLLSLPVYSPHSGLVVETRSTGTGQFIPEGGMNDNQSEQNPSPLSSVQFNELSLKEGMYVQPGQSLFGLQSLSTVWAIIEIYPSAIQSLKTGQAVELHIETFAEPFRGNIDYIEPVYGSGGKNLRVRVYLPNPGEKLKPRTFLTANIQAGSRYATWIPESAVIDLGRHKIVFIKTSEGFQSRKISTGLRSGNILEVTKGLSPDDIIAEHAQLLIDSESFVKVK
ncbi:MAG TPA: efflux RND transporter periplasmic adaptor subunit [Saprospiraceae bacterium]|nr:efflux RND transporter periplasmic adaptor subunit [Saprospiraceae bacterium]